MFVNTFFAFFKKVFCELFVYKKAKRKEA